MTSTTIFAEILVVGLQAAIWLGLLLLLIADFKGGNIEAVLRLMTSFKEWAALITAFMLGLAYALGIIVDRLADSASSLLEKQIYPEKKRREKALEELRKDGFSVELPSSVGLRRLRVMSANPEMTKFLEYIRSRMRIARSTSFNLIPLTLVAVLLARHQNYLWLLILLAGLVLLAVSIYVSLRISDSYYARLSEAYAIIQLTDQQNKEQDD